MGTQNICTKYLLWREMKLPLRKYFLDGAGEGEGGGVGIESTQQRGDQVITLSQQGLTFVENFPDSAMNGPTIDQNLLFPRNKNRTSQ